MQTHAYAPSKKKSQSTAASSSATVYASRSHNQSQQQVYVSQILRKEKPNALTLGQANDHYEKEADNISRQLHDPQNHAALQLVQHKASPLSKTDAEVNSKTEEDETALTQETEVKSQNNTAQKKASIQRKSNVAENQTPSPHAGIAERINNPRGGSRLSSWLKKFVTAVLPYDFSEVKVHQESQDQIDVASVGARAFTFKNHIWLGQGESANDSRLMSHELTHVAQQGAAPYQGLSSSEEVQQSETKIQRNIFGDIADVATDVTDVAGDAWDSGTDFVSDKIDDAVEWGADRFLDLVETVASAEFVEFLREVSSKGIFTYLKEKISDAASSMFDGLSNSSGLLGSIFEIFGGFLATAGEIVIALANGNCEPLFAALKQLKEMAAAIAGDAWTAISDFLAPIGEFFTNLWSDYGAPVLDWLKQTAGDVWQFISDLGTDIWNWTQPVRDAMSSAWDWVKEQLGLTSGEGNGEGGLMSWITDKAQAAWDTIKEELKPITEPIQEVITKVKEVLPLEAIFNLRETINGWLQSVTATASALDEDEGGNVAERQDSLREELLPAILNSILAFRDKLLFAGQWVAEKIGAVISVGTNFLSTLMNTPLLTSVTNTLQWLQESLDKLKTWSVETVQSVFSLLGDALVKLSEFIQPILNILKQIVDTLTNILSKLPDLLLGPVWWLLPKCIKEPIKKFFIEQILGRIPLFGELIKVGDIWAKVRDTALEILARIFIDGDLLGALWLFFKSMLNLIGLPAKLVLSIIIKGATAFSDILMNPIAFIGNLLRSVKQGFFNFFGNIFSNLFSGITDWLFGQLDGAGIKPPTSFSFKAVLTFVLDVLGISVQRIIKKVAEKLGKPELEERIKQMVDHATGAWEWISDVINGGPQALWEKIKEKVSDLWNSVLDGVVGWVNRVIIETASRWLLSLLDVTGITPVINALIATYKAIESFVAYIKEMLEIVESMLISIASIAKGKISDAAAYVENSLVQAVPIVVGFLANQFGFGAVGKRIAEMIEKVREKVDTAIDWLIDKAIKGGQGFIDLLKAGKDAVLNWWKSRTKFKDKKGNDHNLFFEGSENNAQLYVASEKTLVSDYCSEQDGADSEVRKRAYSKYQQIQEILKSLSQGKNETKADDKQKLNTALGELADLLGQTELETASLPDGKTKPIPVRYFKTKSDFPKVLGASADTGVNINGYNLAVERGNFKSTGDILLKKSSRSDGAPMDEIKKVLRSISDDQETSGIETNETKLSPLSTFLNQIWHLDHVRELNLDGKDVAANWWPLSGTKNLAANAIFNQKVVWKTKPHDPYSYQVSTVKNLHEDKYISETGSRTGIPSSSHGTDAEPAAPETGKVQNFPNVANAAQYDPEKGWPYGGSSTPIKFRFLKTKSDFPTITTLEGKPDNLKPVAHSITDGVSLEHIDDKGKKESVKLGGDKILARIGLTKLNPNKRGSESAGFRKAKRILNNLANDAIKNTSGKEEDAALVSQGSFSNVTWQLDHVYESRLGGPQNKGNFWPLETTKNQAANATYNQIIQYKNNDKTETKAVRDLPDGTKLVVMEVRPIPNSSADHGTKNNPANKNDVELNSFS